MPQGLSIRPKSATRCVLFAVTAAVIWAGNYGVEFARTRREQRALAALVEQGAEVRAVRGGRQRAWMSYLLGPSFQGTQYLVQLPRRPITSEEIGLLEKVPHLFQLLPPSTASERDLALLRARLPRCAITPR